MAVVSLTNRQNRIQFFEKSIRVNLSYWLTWLDEAEQADISIWDDERTNVIKAISFGLQLGAICWPKTYQLITAYASYMERRGYWNVWQEVLSKALVVAEAVEDIPGTINLLIMSARLMFNKGDEKQAKNFYRRTIRLARVQMDHYSEARACSNLGYYFGEKGLWQRAEVLCNHALQIFETLESDHGRAHTENHLGLIYFWQGQLDIAESYLSRACAIWQEMADDYGLMRGYINLGTLKTNRGFPDDALSYYALAQEQAQTIGAQSNFYLIEANKAYVYNTLKDNPAQAEICARNAKVYFKAQNQPTQLCIALNNLGGACARQGKYKEGHAYLKTALAIARHQKNARREMEILLTLVEYNLIKKERDGAVNQMNELDLVFERQPNLKQFYQSQVRLKEFQQRLTRLIKGSD